MTDPELLGAAGVRELAARLGLRPTKQRGQNFVVVEVGPGLGSLTLALLPEVAHVTAVEVDPVLAAALPDTVAELQPRRSNGAGSGVPIGRPDTGLPRRS